MPQKIVREVSVGDEFPIEKDGKNFVLRVIEHNEKVAYKVIGPKGYKNTTNPEVELAPLTFRSISAAASSVKGPGNVNGWKFWGIDADEAVPKEKKAKVATKERKAKVATKPKPVAKTTRKARAKVVEEEDEDEEMDFEDEDYEDEEDE